ncbi:hypothetical protein [Paraclostridium sordellii]|uniref:hypothetical protein n=1 Tax=Paraclostridium sordellii TaxID=1505 RepID=UPI0005E5FD81|nr:hypothetical protein [Paeniclostridium sordellii]CEP48177.1 Uncharacterised protein [[Clostridium] sordellii] [Paeniclostridium sordellii]
MKLKIYSRFTEVNKDNKQIDCFLCETTLKEYVENLPDDFKNYGIQREIINNVYLDKLMYTVINKKYIPSISLVSNHTISSEVPTNEILKEFRILDGLQRTYRLKVIYDTYNLLVRKIEEGKNFKNSKKRDLSREVGEDLILIDASIQLFYEIKNNLYEKYEGNLQKFKVEFMNQKQWIEVWNRLSLDDEVEKMLLLNAGQRSVSNKHQIELLFIRVLPNIKNINEKYTIFREKDISSVKFSKNRRKGEYHFSNLIGSLIAFSYGKPIKIDKQLILAIKDDENKVINLNFINLDFINEILEFLYQLDEILEEQYGDKGIQWIARETVLVSIFGALGAYKNQKPMEKLFKEFLNLVRYDRIIDLDRYEDERKNLDLGKVNIGSATKNSIYNSMILILTDKWGTSSVFYDS